MVKRWSYPDGGGVWQDFVIHPSSDGSSSLEIGRLVGMNDADVAQRTLFI